MSQNPNLVIADPAKGFFVSMLIKDITLRDAIGDLVDNAVDAIKARSKDSENLKGFNIEIKLSKSTFAIIDNGYGMEAEVARKYAFNFGKSSSHKLINKSIGQFGIGMKRAFFKIGNIIKVKSISSTSQFNLTIDVIKWQLDEKKWEFEFDKGSLKEKVKNNANNTGLEINVSSLSEDSKNSFNDENFIDKLQKEISLEHMLNINKGLIIKINGQILKSNKITLVNDSQIKPTYWEKKTKDKNVRILAGISTKDADDGGWYIFCNDRLIVAKNQSKETGWGDGVPKYHAQFHRFRGYVFFEANDSSNLPWNTTKTGMDMDSPYFKEVRSQMISMTLQVMGLLNKLKEEKEKDNPEDDQKLNMAVEKSLKAALPVTEVLKKSSSLSNKFTFPIKLFNPIEKSNAVKISYQISNERFDTVKQKLGATNSKQVGLETFNYYFENEI